MTQREHIFTTTGALRAGPTLLVIILGFALALGLTIGYVAKKRHEDDLRWCELFAVLAKPQPTAPPATPQEARGRLVTEEIRKMHDKLRCDGR